MMQNIELFNEYVARILAQLYESFPVKVSLHADQFSSFSDRSQQQMEELVAYSTIEWLVDNGYVHADERIPRSSCYGCTLTDKGLKVLQATPDSVQIPDGVQTKETFGEKLVHLINKGAVEVAKDIVKEILMRGAAGLI